jgi:hypothetical protein
MKMNFVVSGVNRNFTEIPVFIGINKGHSLRFVQSMAVNITWINRISEESPTGKLFLFFACSNSACLAS